MTVPTVGPIVAGILAAAAVATALWGLWRWPIHPVCHALREIGVFILGRPPKGDDPGRKGVLEWQDDVDTKIANLNRHVGNGSKIALREVVDQLTRDVSELRGIQGRQA